MTPRNGGLPEKAKVWFIKSGATNGAVSLVPMWVSLYLLSLGLRNGVQSETEPSSNGSIRLETLNERPKPSRSGDSTPY